MDIKKLIKTFSTISIAIVAFIGCDGGGDGFELNLFPCHGKVVCGVCAPKHAICCEPASIFGRDFPLICSGSRPFCCHGIDYSDNYRSSCAASQDECPVYTPPPPPVVSSPELLTPINHEIITQNNPNIGCPPDPDVGFGFSILFDWTDSISPNGISGYYLSARRTRGHEWQKAPLIETFVTNSEFEFVQCNRFIPNYNLAGFEWFVRAEDNLGNLSSLDVYRDGFEFEFEPCTLPDGSPCGGQIY